MGSVVKVLGQSAPSAATSTTLYTCPGGTQTVISAVYVANRSSTPTSFRLSVDVNGAGDSNEDYFAYDVPIGGNQVVVIGQGVCMDAADLLRCYATLATLTFSAYGEETS
jgi:hypothetical protein